MMDWMTLLSPARAGKKRPDGAVPEFRSAFERDYDRIIFSFPFRRLQNKTQVFPLPEHDFVHTRLTHSLEVSSVGRSLGKDAGLELLKRHPELAAAGLESHDFGAIVSSAALAHDLGNPPFGHAGEEAISDFFKEHPLRPQFEQQMTAKEWKDLTTFEGNAQGFRILNREKYQGLRLTHATLAAFSKYPRESLIGPSNKERRSQKKYGFFQSDLQRFGEVAEATGMTFLGDSENHLWLRHPLAFLVEAADDICYNIIDLEDSCRLGLVSYEATRDLLAPLLGKRYQPEKLALIENKDERVGTLRALAIHELVLQAVEVFLDNEDAIRRGAFDKALVDEVTLKDQLEEISGFSVKEIYRAKPVLELEMTGYEVIHGLLGAFVDAVLALRKGGEVSRRFKTLVRMLPADVQRQLEDQALPLYDALMLCTDYVANMSDAFAITLYRKIKGISLPRR